jgi:GPH family glycoside/pentoside/hexuronide:cation symporter
LNQVYDKKQKTSFALGSLGHWFINAAFSTWVLTFYFAAVGLRIELIMLAFIVWTVWNAVNDPLIGYFSDRTHTRLGRRKPYIIAGIIPMAIIEIIIWLPPNPLQDEMLTFVYLLLMLIIYDTFYTMLSLPYDSLFPELYSSVEERAEVNTYKQILSTIGLLAAFVIPGLFIGDQNQVSGYLTNGIVTSISVIIIFAISVWWGVKERPEFQYDHEHQFSFFQGLQLTICNKGFVLYTLLFFLYEYILLLLSTTVPLFAREVLGITDTFQTSLLLGAMFIVGIITVFIWKILDVKLGGRKAFAISLVAYLIASLPLLFVDSFDTAMIVVIVMGIGFGGMLYFIYLLFADIVDEDEVNTGYRREGTYLGITNFFMRLAMIFSIVSVSLVFVSTGWEQYAPNPGIDVILGLKVLVVIFPAVAIVLSLICLYFYPYSKSYVENIKQKMHTLHEKKKSRIQ